MENCVTDEGAAEQMDVGSWMDRLVETGSPPGAEDYCIPGWDVMKSQTWGWVGAETVAQSEFRP